MRFLIPILLAATLLSCGGSEAPEAGMNKDMVVEHPDGPVRMTPIFHAAVVLQEGSKTIFIDPYDDAARYDSFPSPDMVVITHTHGDHFNKEVLAGLDLSRAELFAPAAVTAEADSLGFAKITTLANGDDAPRGNVTITAVAAYNLPPSEDSFHPPGQFNGYVIEIGGERYYFSGDTEDVAEMRNLKDIDYAFVCMNQPYTMEMAAAADAVLEFKPRVVYPYHYRNGDGTFMDTKAFAALVNEGDKSIEVRLEDWYK
ncbi:MBL fold metallo-hydrolase [Neolewinella lacunae]|uniref:MBL fold metallo-hydrolase n=1 Tax=Neolewinella lacunae TaxID=1517758 RepID=A0A923T8N2_9BACT|nr:MBL fold metallo-hydrolase [Neolewinella lacunae]MBC6994749.1 MBL fold metallo-hydrolase [Neolewinella lacunae]MDN3634371.1 MBL fold metallo-hydrolase [Neolewinella lacunae]